MLSLKFNAHTTDDGPTLTHEITIAERDDDRTMVEISDDAAERAEAQIAERWPGREFEVISE